MRKFSSAGAKNQFRVLIDAARIAPGGTIFFEEMFCMTAMQGDVFCDRKICGQ